MGNEAYINAVTDELIKKLDYLPARDSHGRFMLEDKVIILEKLELSQYTIVMLIDGDNMDSKEIDINVRMGSQYLDALKSNHIEETELVQVFIFNGKPESLKNLIIRNSIENSLYDSDISYVIVEKFNQNVFYWGKNSPNIQSIISILKQGTGMNYTSFELYPDIEEKVYEEIKQEEIAPVTNKIRITYIIVMINAAVWVLGNILRISTGFDYFTIYGSKSNIHIILGEYWRLITPMFLHADLMHLFANSFSLVIFGQVVERFYGVKKMLYIYVIAGITGNIMSFAFTPNVSLGASGAVLGVGGALVFMWIRNKNSYSIRRRQYITLVFLFFFNIVYGFNQTGIDNYAHLGGALGGYLVSGLSGLRNIKLKPGKRTAYLIILFIINIFGLLIGFIRFSA